MKKLIKKVKETEKKYDKAAKLASWMDILGCSLVSVFAFLFAYHLAEQIFWNVIVATLISWHTSDIINAPLVLLYATFLGCLLCGAMYLYKILIIRVVNNKKTT